VNFILPALKRQVVINAIAQFLCKTKQPGELTEQVKVFLEYNTKTLRAYSTFNQIKSITDHKCTIA
jgi:hypothetical protein